MKRAICTTTINEPTEAIKRFIEIAERDDWAIFIAGDKRTNDAPYRELEKKHEGLTYLNFNDQEMRWHDLSDAIGPNCIQRRNFAMLAAWEDGAEYIAVVDDDNIPYPKWGKNVELGKEIGVLTHRTDCDVFDPLSVTHPHIWHRGFPVQLLDKRNIKGNPTRMKMTPLVQADMWDGDPDVDAVARIALAPQVKFNPNMPKFAGDKITPFNSQNTFIHRRLCMAYFLFPHIGRMDDIWAAYHVQKYYPQSVVFAPASVNQDRNEHDLTKDLEAEMIGYKHSQEFAAWCIDGETETKIPEFFPQKALDAYLLWIKEIEKIEGIE